MIDLPIKAEVQCSDAIAGFSTYIVGNSNQQITHLVAQSYTPPHLEYLIPIEQVVEATPKLIKLNCTEEDFNKMELFKYERFIPTEIPSHLSWPYCVPLAGMIDEALPSIPVEHENIRWTDQALRCGAQVEATDGYIGEVEELLIDSTNLRVAYLVVLERQNLTIREITIPVSQIERVDENTIYLKIDRQCVDKLHNTYPTLVTKSKPGIDR